MAKNPKNNCKCETSSLHKVVASVAVSDIKHQKMSGCDYMVVPVVMIVEGVLNGAFVPAEEFMPEAWNGRPVTVGHPSVNNEDVSANSPEILEKFAVGHIFNARLEDNKLKAEAWIDPVLCSEELLAMLKSEDHNMEVSTGYFAYGEEKKGTHNDVEFNEIHRDIKPDHLALLPNDIGACNWSDGCGLRANLGAAMKKSVNEAIRVLAKALNINLEVKPMNTKEKQKLVEALVANKASAFTEKDKETLQAMSDEALKNLENIFKKNEDKEKPEDMEDEDEEETTTNEDEEDPEDMEDEEEKEKAMKKKKNSSNAKQILTNEDKEALVYAKRIHKEHKDKLVSTIKANTNMTEADLKSFSVHQLEKLAGGFTNNGSDFGGRAFPSLETNDADSDVVEAMAGGNIIDMVKKKQEAK